MRIETPRDFAERLEDLAFAKPMAASVVRLVTEIDEYVVGLRERIEALEEAEHTVAVAREVADHWRRALLDSSLEWGAHPLCCVLTALDGETEPGELGMAP